MGPGKGKHQLRPSSCPLARCVMMAGKAVRVLLVEDDDDDYLLARDLFEELPEGAYTLDRVATYDDAIGALSRCDHDLFLIDYRITPKTGLDLVVQARATGCTAPMIILTGQNEHEIDMLASQTGADDFLLKDRLDVATLERSMRYALAQKRLEEEIRLNNSQLEQRVKQRTAELKGLNEALQTEVAER